MKLILKSIKFLNKFLKGYNGAILDFVLDSAE
jgi:hypothetical protein